MFNLACLQIINGALAAAVIVAQAGLKVVAVAVNLAITGAEFVALGAAKVVRTYSGATMQCGLQRVHAIVVMCNWCNTPACAYVSRCLPLHK